MSKTTITAFCTKCGSYAGTNSYCPQCGASIGFIYIEPNAEAKIIMQQQEKIAELQARVDKLESENEALRKIAGSHSMSELRRLQEQTGWRKHGDTLKNKDDTRFKYPEAEEAK